MTKLQKVLEWLYLQEINVSIESFWDAGWCFRIGDRRGNGFKAEEDCIYDLNEGADWLLEQAKAIYGLALAEGGAG